MKQTTWCIRQLARQRQNLRNFAEVHFVRLVLGKLTGTGEHRLDGARRQRVLAFDDEFVAVGRDQLDVHRLGTLAATKHFGWRRALLLHWLGL